MNKKGIGLYLIVLTFAIILGKGLDLKIDTAAATFISVVLYVGSILLMHEEHSKF